MSDAREIPIIEIVSIGKELAEGEVVDTNAAFIAQRLAAAGARVARHVTVTDDKETIRSALADACARACAVVATGGLGPTDDDLTRHAVAALCGASLQLHEPSLEQMKSRFRARGRDMPACNRVQAMMPAGCRVIPNPAGTAAGFVVEHAGATLICLPGVPREMKAMLDAALGYALDAARRAVGRPLQPAVVRTLNTFGLPESRINELLRDMMAPGRNPALGTMACEGVIRLRLVARGESEQEANALLDADEAHIREQLGAAVFSVGDQTLAGVVAEELEAAGLTLATAESCTGGLASHWITNVPGVSRFYRGGVVAYSNDAKTNLLDAPEALIARVGAVSEEVARAMAEGAARRFGADVGVGVTGVAGPTGGTPEKPVGLVHIAAALPERTIHQEFRFAGERTVIQDRAAKSALNLVRLALQERRGADPSS